MNPKMVKLFLELLKNSHRSDRKLARELGTSQPTITRMRNKMEKEGLIQEYTIIPHFIKMGFEIFAITLIKTKFDPDLRKRAGKWVMTKPNIVMCARSEGLGKNGVVVSLHKSYSDYSDFIKEFMEEWCDSVEDYESVIIPFGGMVLKPFSLKYLADISDE